ncbi:STAS domain-containing protein [Nocardioides sp. BP30]|uniref:STAS domain-containing protein n=1 Tax=Nocardioides sp. BP30 TaxID=3036374 RepID=UPI00246967A0|nr:STAS domain-containing protein [Nocardioides sp. BP30]WGL52991.1 STAS domain-containing protein [Nocardioides sp. BP30]
MALVPFVCTYDEGMRTLTLSGDLDEVGAGRLRQQLAAAMVDRSGSLVLDLSAVGSLPSSAVGVIAAARADMRAHFNSLDLVATPGTVASAVLPRYGMSVHAADTRAADHA